MNSLLDTKLVKTSLVHSYNYIYRMKLDFIVYLRNRKNKFSTKDETQNYF